MEEHLFALLSDGLDFPVAWGALGDGVALPRAVLSLTGGRQDYVLGARGLTMSRVQVDCYGATFGSAATAARSVRGILDGYRGGPVERVLVMMPPTTMPGDDAGILHRVLTTFAVHHRD